MRCPQRIPIEDGTNLKQCPLRTADATATALNTNENCRRPDLVLARRKKIIFVHGCFWHGHSCSAATLPKSNRDYWELKQNRNAARDRQNVRALRNSGWKVLIIWECEIKNAKRLQRRLKRFLAAQGPLTTSREVSLRCSLIAQRR